MKGPRKKHRVSVKDLSGAEIGAFYIDPLAPGLIERIRTLPCRFVEITAPLTNVCTNADGTAKGKSGAEIAALKKAEKAIYKLIDGTFGKNVSSIFFCKTRPFARVGGEWYYLRVIMSLTNYVDHCVQLSTAQNQNE